MPRKKSKTRLKLWARRAERLLSEIPATEYSNILKEAEKLCANAVPKEPVKQREKAEAVQRRRTS